MKRWVRFFARSVSSELPMHVPEQDRLSIKRRARATNQRPFLRWMFFGQFIFLLGVSCPPSISFFDETAYQQATSLKVEALRLMEEATEPFSTHEADVQRLQVDLDKAYEYAKGRPKNALSTRQWALLLDTERNLLAGFLKRWEEEETLGPGFVTEARNLISDAFDTIIQLESGKIQEGNAKLIGE